jgi:hypothetical protein
MSKIKDFFFGDISVDGDGPSIGLKDILKTADGVPPSFFTSQIERLLSQNGNVLRIWEPVSMPAFHDFLASIVPDNIGKIVLHAVPTDNDHIRAYVHCDIYFTNGIVHFESDWCAYKDERAKELVNTLIKPLHLFGLNTRSYLRGDDGELSPLSSPYDNHCEFELKSVFKLAKHPSALWVIPQDRPKFQDLSMEVSNIRPCSEPSIPELKWALRAALDWIDAVPEDVQLPSMLGFDRDHVENLLKSPPETTL